MLQVLFDHMTHPGSCDVDIKVQMMIDELIKNGYLIQACQFVTLGVTKTQPDQKRSLILPSDYIIKRFPNQTVDIVVSSNAMAALSDMSYPSHLIVLARRIPLPAIRQLVCIYVERIPKTQREYENIISLTFAPLVRLGFIEISHELDADSRASLLEVYPRYLSFCERGVLQLRDLDTHLPEAAAWIRLVLYCTTILFQRTLVGLGRDVADHILGFIRGQSCPL